MLIMTPSNIPSSQNPTSASVLFTSSEGLVGTVKQGPNFEYQQRLYKETGSIREANIWDISFSQPFVLSSYIDMHVAVV